MNLLGTHLRVKNSLGAAAYFEVQYNTSQVQRAEAGYNSVAVPVGGIHLFVMTGQYGEILRESSGTDFYFQLGVIAYSDPELRNPFARFGISFDPNARIWTSPPKQEFVQGGYYEAIDTELVQSSSGLASSPPSISVLITSTVPPPVINLPMPPVNPIPFAPIPSSPTLPIGRPTPSQDQLNRIVGALQQVTTGLPLGDQGYTQVDPPVYNADTQSIHFRVRFHYEQATFIPNSPVAFDEYYEGDISLSDPLGSIRRTSFSVATKFGLLTLDAASIESLAEAVALILA